MISIESIIIVSFRSFNGKYWIAVRKDGDIILDNTVLTESEAKKRIKNCLATIKW